MLMLALLSQRVVLWMLPYLVPLENGRILQERIVTRAICILYCLHALHKCRYLDLLPEMEALVYFLIGILHLFHQ
ncbi:MAG: hypothetical protein U0794_16000 [Isosphaeraceae bacterium]